MPSHPATLIDLLRARAATHPGRTLYTFLRDDGTEESELTFEGLLRRSRAIGAAIREVAPPGRAVLLYRPGSDYVAGMFGALHAGMVAVPAYPPSPAQMARTLPRLRAIVRDAQASVALTTSQLLPLAERMSQETPELRDLRWVATDVVPSDMEAEWREPVIAPESLAVLQYTSGSTGAPKGVMVSHRNILRNIDAIVQTFQADDDAVCVSWLPPFHDMGLMGTILAPLHGGMRSVLMAPHAFLMSPFQWLASISKYRGTHCGGPNFGFDMCVRKISPERRHALDLRSWRVAFCGAEPVRAEVLARFAEAFAGCGFSRAAFAPCYGLAEATLLVSVKEHGAAPQLCTLDPTELERGLALPVTADHAHARTIVGAGRAAPGHVLKIVDPESRMPLPSGRVGEIWVRGPSITQGYWNREDETTRAFTAHLEMGEGPFLRTGDLGFELSGELFVVGRQKDLIIIRGRNHYPQDIEASAAESHPALRAGCAVACSVEVEGEERLAIALEVDARKVRAFDEVAMAVRSAVSEQHELQPYQVVLLSPGTLPKTTSGKVQRQATRRALRDGTLAQVFAWREEHATNTRSLPLEAPQLPAVSIRQPDEICAWLVEHLSKRMRIPAAAISSSARFHELGLDSASTLSMLGELAAWLGRPLAPTLPWDHPSIARLASHLADDTPSQRASARASEDRRAGLVARTTEEEGIAVIGAACRFPGASGCDAYWTLLREGIDATRAVPAGRWCGPSSLVRGGFLDDVASFDAAFFAISPREADAMDPQQRLLLEVAWEALEHAGICPTGLTESDTGVFVGISSSDYAHVARRAGPLSVLDATGNAPSIAAGRLSYALGLQGPSMAVDTACSSSLVAVHLACQSLRSGESSLALAGGVNLLLDPELGDCFARAGMLAADGRCKTFAASADGYARAEGCGVVVLKRLADARADGDRVLAVVRGSAVNQDGHSNGLTAPNRAAQTALMQRALTKAGVSSADVGYIEAHGTGTPLGDPIELGAIADLIAGKREPQRPLLIGSVKTNLGHLEAAAGIAGLIKVVLALRAELIPPHLNFTAPSANFDWPHGALEVPTVATPWPLIAGRRLAGVSSFGLSGTNAHVVLEQAPAPLAAGNAGSDAECARLLPLSARSGEALAALAASYAATLAERANDTRRLPDILYTATLRRAHHHHRAAVVGSTRAELADRLAALANGAGHAHMRARSASPTRVAFVFPGQGSQWRGMGQELYASERVFAAELDRCARAMAPHLDWSLRDVLVSSAPETAPPFDRVDVVQPLLFAIAVSLAAQWRSWGVEPAAVVGVSQGEIAAAYVAGAIRLEDAAKLVCLRSRLLRRVEGRGGMALVELAADETARRLQPHGPRLSVAVRQGPQATVVSGDADALAALLEDLEREGIFCRRVKVDYASHSPQMDELRGPLLASLGALTSRPACVPFYSTVTGSELPTGGLDGPYWYRNLRETVRFGQAIEALKADGIDTFIELSAHPVLAPGLASQLALEQASGTAVGSLRRDAPERRELLENLGTLYCHGLDVDWKRLNAGAQVVDLPSYPWQRVRHWHHLSATAAPAPRPAKVDPRAVAEWLLKVEWEQRNVLPRRSLRARRWLLLGDGDGIAGGLRSALESRGDAVVHAVAAGSMCVASAGVRHFDDTNPCAVRHLLAHAFEGAPPTAIVHLRSLESSREPEALDAALTRGCDSVLHTVQALASLQFPAPPRLWLVTRGAQDVDDVAVDPAQTALVGLGRVIANEHPDLRCVRADLDPRGAPGEIDALCADLMADDDEDEIAWRGSLRYVARLSSMASAHVDPKRAPAELSIRANGSYLISGGLGQLGLSIAGWLAERGAGQLVLLGRKGVTSAAQKATIAALEALGTRVIVRAVDVCVSEQLASVLEEIASSHLPLRGVFHAAGVLADGLLTQQTADRFRHVMAPKIKGAWNLHNMTSDQELELFVMCSSAAALLGSPGQGNYAAACAFLDGLAQHRQARGGAALSIAFGPFEDLGLAAGRGRSQRLSAAGVLSLSAAEGLAALGCALDTGLPHVGVVALDAARWVRSYPVAAATRFLSRLAQQAGTEVSPASRRARVAELIAVDAEERRRLLEAFLRTETARVLRMPADRLDTTAALTSLGMDSLMGVELRNCVAAALDVRIPVALIVKHASLAMIADFISLELLRAAVDDRSRTAPADTLNTANIHGAIEGLERIAL